MSNIDLKKYENQKNFLKRYRKNKLLIDRLESKLARLDDRLYNVKCATLNKIGTSSQLVTLDELISDKDDLQKRINKLLIKSRKYKREIEEQIDLLDDVRYAEILEMFFIELKGFEIIADELGYTIRHVIRLYSEAINELVEITDI